MKNFKINNFLKTVGILIAFLVVNYVFLVPFKRVLENGSGIKIIISLFFGAVIFGPVVEEWFRSLRPKTITATLILTEGVFHGLMGYLQTQSILGIFFGAAVHVLLHWWMYYENLRLGWKKASLIHGVWNFIGLLMGILFVFIEYNYTLYTGTFTLILLVIMFYRVDGFKKLIRKLFH